MENPLINVGPGGVMEAGLAAARHKESVQFWHDGENIAFRNLGVEKALGAVPVLNLGSKVVRLAQAYCASTRRIYFQREDFSIWGWDEATGFPYFLGNPGNFAQLQPWGTWLFCAVSGSLFVWKNSGALIQVSAPDTYNLAILNDHLLCIGQEIISWPDIRNAENFVANAATTSRTLRLRNLESDLLAAKPLAQGIGVYTKDALRLITYKGSGFWFGKEREPVNGIGALGPNSIISAGFKNYGLSRNGIFVTDGTSYQYIDTPAFHGYLESRLDWERGREVFGFHNENFQEVVWFYPDLDGTTKGLAFKYTNGGFTKYDFPISASLDRDVFPYPIFGTPDGLAFGRDRSLVSCFVRTKPLDAGDSLRFKWFDFIRFVGQWAENARLRLGVSDEVNAEPEWFYDGVMITGTYIEREAVFLTIELSADSLNWFEISQILVDGKLTGRRF